ncbi:LysM peptidoglycan-binding domain-containing protein [Bacillus sp. EAC]|uniref:LysM peptidoglycan-binding domain-containing protein n=1 Tax=Bacillus sp. EAC TaxID=1978338 RepID=UPI000B441E71|nr:LysM peptidoglycan-binding domain-containing protein [Bacillus sp. EAC]
MSRKHQEKKTRGLSRKSKNKVNSNHTSAESIDLLNLPPRSKSIQIKEDKRRPWWKLKYPLLTVLVFLFILLPIGLVSLVHYKYGEIFTNKASIFLPSNKFEKVKVASTKDTDGQKDDLVTQKPIENNQQDNNQNTSKNPTQISDESFGIKEIKHTVKNGETLFSISMKYFGNRNGEEIIQEANGLENIEVVPGQVLTIPLGENLNK